MAPPMNWTETRKLVATNPFNFQLGPDNRVLLKCIGNHHNVPPLPNWRLVDFMYTDLPKVFNKCRENLLWNVPPIKDFELLNEGKIMYSLVDYTPPGKLFF